MPLGDGTGPMKQGQGTGRGMGFGRGMGVRFTNEGTEIDGEDEIGRNQRRSNGRRNRGCHGFGN